MVPDALTRRVRSDRSVDALRFLERGTALLDAVVLIKAAVGDATFVYNGVRITPELVLTLRDGDVAMTNITIDDTPFDAVWKNGPAMLVRTTRYEGSLPELSLRPNLGDVTLVSMNPAGEARIGFGRVVREEEHDAPSETGSMGAPLFDETWGILGLHDPRFESERGFVLITELLRDLEQSPWWDEIAAVHRLVRTGPTDTPRGVAAEAPDLARAVRWSPEDDAPLPERERRRAVAGKTPAELREARGAAAPASPEQRAVDRILDGGPYTLDTIPDDILLPFATAARWFRGVVPGLPDDQSLEREIDRRRQYNALVAIVGPHFAPREEQSRRLHDWLANPNRPAVVILGPGGIGKSALLAHFILEHQASLRFAWIDFDRPDVSADESSITRVVEQQLAWQTTTGRLVVVLDSFETAVQTYGYTNLNPALDAIARRFDDLALLVGSRAPVPLLKVQGDSAEAWELPGLPLKVVTDWLVAEDIAPDVAAEIAEVTNGVPLNMKLARDLVKGKSEAEVHEIVASLPKQLVTGYLYRRILRRLNDDTLKDSAQWAMVPRRLVPELLALVARVSKDESERLFDALRGELTLLEGDKVLTVRADLRNTLLPLLAAEDANRVREIDKIAADFWSPRASDDAAAAADAIYHSLRISDITQADRLWRSGLAPYLGGYAMDELQPESRSWLEARLSRERSDRAASDLLARGDAAAATNALRDRPIGVETVSDSKRRRRIAELAAESNLDQAGAGTAPAFERIVLETARPNMRVRNGTFVIASQRWTHLEKARASLEHAIAAVGRIRLSDGTILGSATCVGPGLFITTRSVAEQFSVGTGRNVTLIDSRDPMLDMQAEGDPGHDLRPVTRVAVVHGSWDVAIVEVSASSVDVPVPLTTSEPAPAIDVVVVGHPSDNPQEHDLVSDLFEGAFDVKRLMPGKYTGRQVGLSFGRTINAGCDDAIAVGPDIGAAVIDPETGRLIGIRFSWVFLDKALFVPAWELASDPEIANTLAPSAADAYAASPADAVSVGHTLLDAYLARSSGDLARARALLATVPPDGDAAIVRTVLAAACESATNPVFAGDLLHRLVERVPRSQWVDADLNAVIATRLRLAVDADAERQFLKMVTGEPPMARLVDVRHFRVLAPPGGNLPWNLNINKTGPVAFVADTRFPAEANSVAQRIVDASNRCTLLLPWISSYGMELANLGYIFNTSPSDAREVAAAYVAYPFALVGSMTAFLLEKTDLAPHPSLGWAPIAEPLMMLFRQTRGSLPDGVTSEQDMEGWLGAHASSSRLGAYLTESLRFDAPVAWQAGLLHLTTELPIEGLLRRRFTALA